MYIILLVINKVSPNSLDRRSQDRYLMVLRRRNVENSADHLWSDSLQNSGHVDVFMRASARSYLTPKCLLHISQVNSSTARKKGMASFVSNSLFPISYIALTSLPKSIFSSTLPLAASSSHPLNPMLLAIFSMFE